MKQEEVPQDAAILDQLQEITYAVDSHGDYVLVPSAGWEPANLANLQAWQLIAEEIEGALQQIRDDGASPLLFHMVRNQMDITLLARYVHLPRWRVKRHLQAKHFWKLSTELRERYAAVFRLPITSLDRVPEKVELPVALPEFNAEEL